MNYMEPLINRIGGILLLGLFLGGCTQTLRVPAEVAVPPPADLRGATLYRIAAEQSSLHVLVYRGGTLANLGHNHVLSCSAVSGYVWRHAEPARSGFDLMVPVDQLIVDDDEARRAEGADFPLNLSEQAKQGTGRNLLGADVLDAVRFPRIRINSAAIAGPADRPQVTAAITLKNVTRNIALPVELQQVDEALRVRGEFVLRQSDFGIKPYSVALGALQVQDEVKIKFELLALPAS